MAQELFTSKAISRFSMAGWSKLRSILIAGVIFAVLGILTPYGPIYLFFITSATTLTFMTLLILLARIVDCHKNKQAQKTISSFLEKDPAPSFLVTNEGIVESINLAAKNIFGGVTGETLANVLRYKLANPDSILFRLHEKARQSGTSRENIATSQGQIRLSAFQMNAKAYLWRIEDEVTLGGEQSIEGGLPMVITSQSGKVTFINRAAKSLIGKEIYSIYDVIDKAALQSDHLIDLASESGRVKVRIILLDLGEQRQAVYLSPVRESIKKSPGAAQESKVDLSFEDLPVPLLGLSADGTILSFNETATEFTGVSLRVGSKLSEILEGLGRPLTDWLSETLSGRATQNSEFLRLRQPEKEIFVQVSLSRVLIGGEFSLIAVLTDATELKTLEARFVQSQKMQAIGQLAGGIAHDFNNLLTAISGHCDLLLLRHDPGSVGYNDLVQINQNANRAAALVGQLLAFSRKQTLRLETLDVRDTLSDLIHLLNRLVGERVNLTLNNASDLGSIRADKRQLEQVLMNLVVNARDAMKEGGEIRIETANLTLQQPMERNRVLVPVGDYVTIRVIDQGGGISPDKLEKIFEPFYTTKRLGEGTGLGLSMAYGIVKQSGGYIFVDSNVGVGTCFTLMFPTSHEEQPLPQVQEAPPSPPPSHGEGIILLVEDEAPVRAFASRALQIRGYTVIEADSAETALELLGDTNLKVDLFVTDVVMPGRDGPSWVREARKTRPDVKVIFMSGYAEEKFVDEKNSIENSVFLPKPFSLSELTETVHQQLN